MTVGIIWAYDLEVDIILGHTHYYQGIDIGCKKICTFTFELSRMTSSLIVEIVLCNRLI